MAQPETTAVVNWRIGEKTIRPYFQSWIVLEVTPQMNAAFTIQKWENWDRIAVCAVNPPVQNLSKTMILLRFVLYTER